MPKSTGKHKLLSIENKYQQLQYILNTYGSERLKLEYLRLFLYELVQAKNESIYFSYFDELIQEYSTLITAGNLEYRSIEVLKTLKLIGKTFIDQNSKDTQAADFLKSQAIIANQIALTYIYLGEWYQALRVFFPNLKQTDFKKVSSNLIQDLSNASESTMLQKYVRTLGKDTLKKNQDIKALLNTLKSWEDASTKTQNDKIWVLLVEHESQNVFEDNNEAVVALGNIQQLSTNAHNLPSDSAQDFVLFNNLSISYNDLLYQQANTAIKVAKDSLGKNISKSNNKYNVIYSFLKKESYYSGASLGLAMTLSTISNISKNNDYKNKYSLLQDYGITGSIANNGAVNSISDQALAIKLKTVFYSPFKKMLIPESNKKQAVVQLQKLKKEYPQRDLEIIAVSNIKDAIVNQKLTQRSKIALKQRFKRKSIYWYITTISVLTLLLMYHFIFTTNIDLNPVKLKVSDDKIAVYNIAGVKLWDYDLEYKSYIKIYEYGKEENISMYVFDDLNNDGLNELLIGFQNSEAGRNGSLNVFSSKGKLLWKFNEHPVITFGEEQFNDIYTITNVKIHTFDGTKKIFASFTKYLWYPSRLVELDIDGKVLGEYWNAGIAHIRQFFDIDEDGIDEIILSGCNNDYNTGIMAILEHDNIEGHSPQINKAYIPQGVPEGTEKYYIKFPDPKELLINTRRSSVIQVVVMNDQLIIQDVLAKNTDFSAFYILNKNFEITSFDMGDFYIANYNKRTGRDFLIDYPSSKLKAMFYKLEFWDGEKFVTDPVMSNPD